MDFETGLAALAAAFVVAGLGGGFLAGLLGVGGGIVVVPVLYHAYGLIGLNEDLRMHMAVGTSLATIIPTSISSWRSHARKNAVDLDLLKRWAPALALGAIAGGIIGTSVRGDALSLVFATVAIIVALQMCFLPDRARLGAALPAVPAQFAAAGGIGSVSAMMGIGGGTLSVPFLTLFSFPIHRAVGTASAIGFVIAVPAAISFAIGGMGEPNLPAYSIGYVNLLGFAVIATVSYFTAPYGAAVAHAVSRPALRALFAVFLSITAARMIYGVLT